MVGTPVINFFLSSPHSPFLLWNLLWDNEWNFLNQLFFTVNMMLASSIEGAKGILQEDGASLTGSRGCMAWMVSHVSVKISGGTLPQPWSRKTWFLCHRRPDAAWQSITFLWLSHVTMGSGPPAQSGNLTLCVLESYFLFDQLLWTRSGLSTTTNFSAIQWTTTPSVTKSESSPWGGNSIQVCPF